MRLDYAAFDDVKSDVDTLLDRLDIVLTGGTLDTTTRLAIDTIIRDIDDDDDLRLRIALVMFLISPDYAVRL